MTYGTRRNDGSKFSKLTLLLLLFAALCIAAAAIGQTTRPRTTTTAQPSSDAQQPTTANSPQTDSPSSQATPPPPPTPSSTTPPVVSATPPPDDDEDEVIRITSNLVVVPVSVTDAKGELVRGLMANDFRLDEEGRKQEIARVGDPEEVPIELALLLDVSGSINARFAFEREAASRFLKTVLKPADRAAIFAIDTQPRMVSERASVDAATQKLLAVEPSKKATAFYDTVAQAAQYLRNSTPPRARRVIVCISDGDDTYSENFATIAKTLPEVQRADAVFYSINPSGKSIWLNVRSKRGQSELQQLATATGGAAFLPDMLEDLDAVFRQITNELRSQYLLQYYSTNNSGNNQFIRINVRTPARADLRVRARQGYYRK